MDVYDSNIENGGRAGNGSRAITLYQRNSRIPRNFDDLAMCTQLELVIMFSFVMKKKEVKQVCVWCIDMVFHNTLIIKTNAIMVGYL